MGKYPVIFLSMKDVEKIKNKFIEDAIANKHFDIAMGNLDNFIKHLYQDN